MSNDHFKFKQFTVYQQCCAMKVGTDGTLLGAWAMAPEGETRILDIGTGTGLIALMMAQRFPNARIVGIDIDGDAVQQARQNVMESPFSDRIDILHTDLNTYAESVFVDETDDSFTFDAIVSNPPYFTDALTCPDSQRAVARHTVSLTYSELMKSSVRLLQKNGILSVIIPCDCRSRLVAAANLNGLFTSRVCQVKTTPRKSPKRQLIEFLKHPVNKLVKEEQILEILGSRSEWYQQLTEDFYIK